MHIHPKGSTGPIGPDNTRSSQSVRSLDLAPATGAGAGQGSRVSDVLEISDAGRALAARGADADATSELDQARTARIRAQVLSGAYDSLEVVDAIARRLLRSGDL